MRSIRVSLLAWFLGLLTLAFGTAALLVYRSAERTLQEKYSAQAKLVERQFEKNLLKQAETLASLTRFSTDMPRMGYSQLHWLGVLTTGFTPGNYCCIPTWLAEGDETALSGEMFRLRMLRWRDYIPVRFNDTDHLAEYIDRHRADFFQIDLGDPPIRYVSESLAGELLPLDLVQFAGKQDDYAYSDRTLASGRTVRRVIFLSPLSRFIGPKLGPAWTARTQPIYIQCASDLALLQAELEPLAQQRDRELAGLKTRLLLIGTLTLLAAAGGSFWIVRHGLAPLRRLSDAVSRVSPQHLQLPIGPHKLPVELEPIVERLTETLRQLSRAFAREQQATADISHELRTPLAALLTTTEIALRKPRTTEEYHELLADCRLSAQQMNQVVERLLTLARLDAGVDHLRAQPVDAAALAAECAAVVRPLAEARNLQLNLHRNGAARVRTDPDKLRDVLTNLLHNAIQYNRPNGSIDLRVELQDRQLTLEVRDTGIGIAPEARERIFERFYRADPARCADGLHAGLGLALVKEYVQLMGGSITVDSVVGRGSTFRIDLPVA